MHFPKFWAPARQESRASDGRVFDLRAWGWSDLDLSDARRMAEGRLQNMAARLGGNRPLNDKSAYGYGERPLREEVIDSYPGGLETLACVTRNRYGSLVLNTATLMFIDVDLPESVQAKPGLLSGLFGRKSTASDPRAERRTALRAALERLAPTRFALYDTAAGFRALAINRAYAPDSSEVAEVMRVTGADRQFAALCKRQKSFRARLTPKPWRIGQRLPPNDFPRDPAGAASFSQWLARYDQAARGHATCRFVEFVGASMSMPEFAPLIALHDEATRARSGLPLA